MDFMKAAAEGGPRALLDFKVQVAAVALAQLSLAPSAEYVGAGTVLCALHKVRCPCSSLDIQGKLKNCVRLYAAWRPGAIPLLVPIDFGR